MHIKIGEKDCLIHIKEELEHIRITRVEENTIRLEVPAQLPQENLLLYIKNNLSADLASWQSKLKQAIYSLVIFDKKYAVKVLSVSQPYIYANCIYCNEHNLASSSQIEKLKEQLLLNFLNDMLSKLEEDIEILLPAIKLRKLKTNYFSICHNTNHITFSKELIHKSQPFITYVIITAVNSFRGESEAKGKHLIERYVPEWKHIEQVLAYERQQ